MSRPGDAGATRAWVLFLLGLVTVFESAAATKFRLPLAGDTSVHYYYDHDLGASLRDWRCGIETYDGHKGTDYSGGPRGKAIYASATGILIHKVDGFGDGWKGNEDGNGYGNHVRLDHGGGLLTYYAHMTAGSVTSKVLRSMVTCSEQIGGVGTSGSSTNLHLHFEPKLNGVGFDPYSGSCNSVTESWWVNQGTGSPGTACEAIANFSGSVTDTYTGNGVSDASVTWGIYETTTDSYGAYSLHSVQCETATTLSVSKNGYLTHTESYKPQCYSSNLKNVSLTPTAGQCQALTFGYAVTADTCAPANDSCANAKQLQSSTSCSFTAGTVSNATASGFAKPACDGRTSPNMYDVWYKFTASDPSHTVIVDPSTAIGDPVVSVYSSCSISASPIACGDTGEGATETVQLLGLTVGSAYYVRVYDYGNIEPTGSDAEFRICVTHPAPSTCYSLTSTHTGQGADPTPAPLKSAACSSSYQYVAGESITLSASPSSGWNVSSWTGTDNDSSTSATNSMSMPSSNRTVSVAYSQIPPSCYALSLTHTGSGGDPTASPSNSTGCSSGRYVAGQSINLTAFPASGWRVSGWSGTSHDASTSTTNTLTMPAANRTVGVTYSEEGGTTCSYTLSPSSAPGQVGGGSSSFTVASAPSGCAGGSWSASSNSSWLNLTGTQSGSGQGYWSVPYSYGSNPGAAREGTVTVSGASPGTFRLTQVGTGGSTHGFIAVPSATVQVHDLGVGPDGSVYVLYGTSNPKTLHVVKSVDGASTWQSPVSLPSSTYTNSDFRMAVDSAGVIHVVWYVSSDDQVYYSRSTNSGASFSTPIGVRTGNLYNGYRTENGVDPAIGSDGAGNVYVAYGAYTTNSSGTFIGYNVWVSRSTNGGSSFQSEFPITEITSTQKKPRQVRATDADLYVLFMDETNDDLYCHRRAVGASSGTTGRVNGTAGSVQYGGDLLVGSNGYLYAVYSDTTGDYEGNITFVRSPNGGATWSGDVRANDSSTRQQYDPEIGFDGSGRLHTAWTDGRANGRAQAYYAYSENEGASFSANENISASMTDSRFTQTHLVVDLMTSSLYISATKEVSQVMVARLSTTPSPAQPPSEPSGLLATAVSGTRVDLTWAAVANAGQYRVERKAAGGSFTEVGTAMTNSYTDNSAAANKAYLYRVIATNQAGGSSPSGADLATTSTTTTAIAGHTVSSNHMQQMREAVNAVRALAGLNGGSYTYTAATGTSIRALDIVELRAQLDAALSVLGVTGPGYTETPTTGMTVKSLHVSEVQNRMR